MKHSSKTQSATGPFTVSRFRTGYLRAADVLAGTNDNEADFEVLGLQAPYMMSKLIWV